MRGGRSSFTPESHASERAALQPGQGHGGASEDAAMQAGVVSTGPLRLPEEVELSGGSVVIHPSTSQLDSASQLGSLLLDGYAAADAAGSAPVAEGRHTHELDVSLHGGMASTAWGALQHAKQDAPGDPAAAVVASSSNRAADAGAAAVRAAPAARAAAAAGLGQQQGHQQQVLQRGEVSTSLNSGSSISSVTMLSPSPFLPRLYLQPQQQAPMLPQQLPVTAAGPATAVTSGHTGGSHLQRPPSLELSASTPRLFAAAAASQQQQEEQHSGWGHQTAGLGPGSVANSSSPSSTSLPLMQAPSFGNLGGGIGRHRVPSALATATSTASPTSGASSGRDGTSGSASPASQGQGQGQGAQADPHSPAHATPVFAIPSSSSGSSSGAGSSAASQLMQGIAGSDRRQRKIEVAMDVASLALFYASFAADAMVVVELVRRGAPGLWWALVLAFMSAGPALMGFVVLLHNGWLAICLRCFCHLLEGHDGAGLTEPWPYVDFLRKGIQLFLLAVMALFGGVITTYCVLCFALVAVCAVPMLDFSTMVATLCPGHYKSLFKAHHLVFLENYKFARFGLQALFHSLPQAVLLACALALIPSRYNVSAGPLVCALAIALANLCDKAAHSSAQVRLVMGRQGVVTPWGLVQHVRDMLTLKGAYRVPSPVMEVTLAQMLRSGSEFVVGAPDALMLALHTAGSAAASATTPSGAYLPAQQPQPQAGPVPGAAVPGSAPGAAAGTTAQGSVNLSPAASGALALPQAQHQHQAPSRPEVRLGCMRIVGPIPLVPRFLLPYGGGRLVHGQMVTVMKEALARYPPTITTWALEYPVDRCLAALVSGGLQRFTSLQQLTICKCKVAGRGFAQVATQMVAHPHLRCLKLSQVELDGAAAGALADFLRDTQRLEVLDISGCTLPGPRFIARLARALRSNHSLVSLTLSNNGIGKPGAQALAENLPHNTRLEFLDLSGNKLGPAGAQALADALAAMPMPQASSAVPTSGPSPAQAGPPVAAMTALLGFARVSDISSDAGAAWYGARAADTTTGATAPGTSTAVGAPGNSQHAGQGQGAQQLPQQQMGRTRPLKLVLTLGDVSPAGAKKLVDVVSMREAKARAAAATAAAAAAAAQAAAAAASAALGQGAGFDVGATSGPGLGQAPADLGSPALGEGSSPLFARASQVARDESAAEGEGAWPLGAGAPGCYGTLLCTGVAGAAGAGIRSHRPSHSSLSVTAAAASVTGAAAGAADAPASSSTSVSSFLPQIAFPWSRPGAGKGGCPPPSRMSAEGQGQGAPGGAAPVSSTPVSALAAVTSLLSSRSNAGGPSTPAGSAHGAAAAGPTMGRASYAGTGSAGVSLVAGAGAAAKAPGAAPGSPALLGGGRHSHSLSTGSALQPAGAAAAVGGAGSAATTGAAATAAPAAAASVPPTKRFFSRHQRSHSEPLSGLPALTPAAAAAAPVAPVPAAVRITHSDPRAVTAKVEGVSVVLLAGGAESAQGLEAFRPSFASSTARPVTAVTAGGSAGPAPTPPPTEASSLSLPPHSPAASLASGSSANPSVAGSCGASSQAQKGPGQKEQKEQKQGHAEPQPDVTLVFVCGEGGPRDLVDTICSAHRLFEHLSELELPGLAMGDVGAVAVADCIRQAKGLTRVDLSRNLITDVGVSCLLSALEAPASSPVRTIDLSGNLVGDEGAAAICCLLKHLASRREAAAVTAVTSMAAARTAAAAAAAAAALQPASLGLTAFTPGGLISALGGGLSARQAASAAAAAASQAATAQAALSQLLSQPPLRMELLDNHYPFSMPALRALQSDLAAANCPPCFHRAAAAAAAATAADASADAAAGAAGASAATPGARRGAGLWSAGAGGSGRSSGTATPTASCAADAGAAGASAPCAASGALPAALPIPEEAALSLLPEGEEVEAEVQGRASDAAAAAPRGPAVAQSCGQSQGQSPHKQQPTGSAQQQPQQQPMPDPGLLAAAEQLQATFQHCSQPCLVLCMVRQPALPSMPPAGSGAGVTSTITGRPLPAAGLGGGAAGPGFSFVAPPSPHSRLAGPTAGLPPVPNRRAGGPMGAAGHRRAASGGSGWAGWGFTHGASNALARPLPSAALQPWGLAHLPPALSPAAAGAAGAAAVAADFTPHRTSGSHMGPGVPQPGTLQGGAGPSQQPGAVTASGPRHSRTVSHVTDSSDGDMGCGVCFDNPNNLTIKDCGHHLCVACYRELVKPDQRGRVGQAVCPFCRGPIKGFEYRLVHGFAQFGSLVAGGAASSATAGSAARH